MRSHPVSILYPRGVDALVSGARMSIKPAYARHQVDLTAKALQAEAKRLGVGVLLLGGVIDAALYLGQTVRLVDFKGGSGHTLTDAQAKAVAAGAPIRFISDVAQLQQLVAEMKAEQAR